ncbi:hypothetical protein B0H19DRAFT_1375213 [Mycena capillaripes]|nr:hypothetical protein B0H19DRAFT_1375213 [Mycena capillaripes]
MPSEIHRLPTEIISEIFVHCSTKHDGCKPRLVATVCTRWREVALATSKLWSNIHVHQEEIKSESLLSLLALQLQRSGQVPLSVVFYDRRLSVLELLLTASHRWESLDLDILNPTLRECLRASPNPFPILKKLRIQITSPFVLGNLSRAPLLEELTLIGVNSSVPSKLLWPRLTKCTIFYDAPKVVLAVLRSASTMEELCLYNCCYAMDQDPDLTMDAVTSAIRSLKISCCSTSFNQDFLGHLTTPNLEELILDDFTGNTYLTSLLAGSSGPITHLSLCDVRVSERELIALLRLTDALDHLEISWPYDVHSNVLMEALTILPGNRRRILPRLRMLNITGGLSCHDDILLTMLRSRHPVLERVELNYAGRTFFFDRALDGLRKAGMKISMLLDGPVDPFADGEEEDIVD